MKIHPRNLIGGTLALAMAGSLALSTGCRHRDSSGLEGSAAAVQAPDGNLSLSKYVIVNNPQLAKGIQIVDLKTKFHDNGLMMANVTLVSKARKTLDFQYRFAWMDENGIEVDPESQAWKPMKLYGNESRAIQGTAPNAAAREFRIKLRKM